MKPTRTFMERLNSCANLEELEGFANRRRYLPSLPKWTAEERQAIILRKYEMEKLK